MNLKNVCEKITEVYLLLFATVHLLYLGFSGYSHIFEAKILTFCTINILYFVSLLIALFLFWDKNKKRLAQALRRRLNVAHICVLLYMIFTVISGLLSEYFPKTIFGISRFEGMFTICIYGFMFFAVSFFTVSIKRVFYAFTVSASLFCALCILQILGFNSLHLYPEGMNFYDAGVKYTTAFIGTIGNTNLSGAFICLALPIFLVLLFKSKNKKHCYLLIPVALLTFTALTMDVTSTILGLISAVIISFPLILSFRKRNTIIYVLSVSAVITIILFLILFYPPKTGFIHELSRILHGDISDSFGSGRIRIWKNVLGEIPDSPVFGKGPDTMMMENFAPFERYYPALGKVKRTSIDVAHNEFLNILYHQGFLALLAYLAFLFFVIKAWIKNRQNIVVLALGCGIVCYLAQSFFTFSMCLTAPYFWICAGLIIGMSDKIIKEPALC